MPAFDSDRLSGPVYRTIAYYETVGLYDVSYYCDAKPYCDGKNTELTDVVWRIARVRKTTADSKFYDKTYPIIDGRESNAFTFDAVEANVKALTYNDA